MQYMTIFVKYLLFCRRFTPMAADKNQRIRVHLRLIGIEIEIEIGIENQEDPDIF